jgi:hypothetical protein
MVLAGAAGNGRMTGGPVALARSARRKILRQHRDLRRVLEITLSATEAAEEAPGARRLPLLVALALRLQNMLDRHFAFEESVLIPHFLAEDPTRVDHLVDEHRKQRAELSVLAKLAFQNVSLPNMGQAFRCLIEKILAEMEEEERELLHGVRRRAPAKPRERAVTGEFATQDALVDCDDDELLIDDDPAARRGSE